MDAAEFFRDVVKPNYQESVNNPHSFRSLWNTLVSMNTVAEFVALERIEYAAVSRNKLMESANVLRDQSLADLKFCVEALKHVRKIEDNKKLDEKFTILATSTGISPHDQTTWEIGPYKLTELRQRAFATLTTFPELN